MGVSKCKFLQNDPKLGLHPEPVNYPTFRYKINLASTAKLMRQLSVTCHHCFHECFQWPPKVPSKYSIGGIRDTGKNTSIQTTSLVPPSCTHDVCVCDLRSLWWVQTPQRPQKSWGKRGGSFIAITTEDDFIIFCKIKWNHSETVHKYMKTHDFNIA